MIDLDGDELMTTPAKPSLKRGHPEDAEGPSVKKIKANDKAADDDIVLIEDSTGAIVIDDD